MSKIISFYLTKTLIFPLVSIIMMKTYPGFFQSRRYFMTIRSLKIFVEVAESGKISDTARKLYITQASVSQCISEIEKE